MELQLTLDGGANSPFGVKVFAAIDGREETVIRYEPQTQELVIDFIHSSASGPVSILAFDDQHYDPSKDILKQFTQAVTAQRAPLVLGKDETLNLRIFIDRCIIEVFANERQVVTQVVYPELETSNHVKVFSGDEALKVTHIRSWQMAQTNAY